MKIVTSKYPGDAVRIVNATHDKSSIRILASRRPREYEVHEHDAATPDGWLTATEVEQKLGWRDGAVRDLMRAGILRRSQHYIRRAGSRPLFSWPALVRWLAEGD